LERIDSNEGICNTFGKIKSELERDGDIIDDADLFIACCALKTNRVLVTNNERHFSRIKDLKIKNWPKPDRKRTGNFPQFLKFFLLNISEMNTIICLKGYKNG
jgi:hypothetical protein